MKREQIEFILGVWWTGIDPRDGKPLKLWERLPRNHFRPDIDHLRAMLAAVADGVHSIQVDVTGEDEATTAVEVRVFDRALQTITGDEPTPRGDAPTVEPLLVSWRPSPAAGDRRTVMDVRYNGRSHGRHMQHRAELAAAAVARQEAALALAAAETERQTRRDRVRSGDDRHDIDGKDDA